MRALITGITGFAGSFLSEHLLESGDQVMGCSRSARWTQGVPVELASDISLLTWDVRQEITESARKEIEAFAPQWIFHLAAISTPSDCGGIEPNDDAVATNVEGTSRVIDLALSMNEPPRVLLTSSCHVYRPATTQAPIVTEDSELTPARAYGKTKLWAEEKIFQAVQQRGLQAVIARAFHHTGPRQSARTVLPEWVRQFAKTDGFPVQVQTLDAYLDLSDVRDVVRAYRCLLEQGRTGEAYNIGTGKCRRSGDIFTQLTELADPDRAVKEVAPQVVQQPIADITKIRTDTNWRPEIPLQQTLADTLAYWRRK